MTSEELAAIKARAEAATPGPWKRSDEESGDYYVPGWYVEVPVSTGSQWIASSIDDQPDAAFIAHARTDVPALIAEVEILRRALHGVADVMPAEKFRRVCLAAGLSDSEAKAIFAGVGMK